MPRLSTCQNNLRLSVQEVQKHHDRLMRAESTLLVAAKLVCEADPDIKSYNLEAALKTIMRADA